MKKTKFLLALIFFISPVSLASMQMDEKGMVMNANSDNLPKDCPQISETVDLTVHAGHKYAAKFNGKMFAFDQQEWNVKPCAKINITFINDDQIRHQFMIHGLPGYLYPDGMLHLELYGEGELKASLILPSQKKTYLVHCELAQHAEKGMKAQLKVGGGDGNLPSIPAISAPIKTDNYSFDWTVLKWGSIMILLTVTLVIVSGRWILLHYFWLRE
ncbi:MAG: copper oxidase [Methylococcaceae bacterium]